jgi:hypothetical protein
MRDFIVVVAATVAVIGVVIAGICCGDVATVGVFSMADAASPPASNVDEITALPISSSPSCCGDNNTFPLPVLNALSVDCLFDPCPPPLAEVKAKPTPIPPNPLLPLLLCLLELLRLTGVLELDFDERLEMVEIRRESAGEGGAGRVDERDGEPVRMGDIGARDWDCESDGL